MNSTMMTPPFAISAYEIVGRRSAGDMTEEINDFIQRGYVIWGMPFKNDNGGWWYQVMIKPAQPQGVYHGNPDHFGEGMFRV